MILMALLLLWLFVCLVLYAWWAQRDPIPGIGNMFDGVKKVLVGPKCPTCGQHFIPDKCRWETHTTCLDGLDYCAECKVKSLCGC